MEDKKFTHQAPVVKINLEKHPNADSLSIVSLFDGLSQVVVNTKSWEGVEYGIWVQPQSLVDTDKPEFSFLKREGEPNIVRIKPVKLRGVTSNGILIPTQCNEIGKDMSDELGIQHWEPEESLSTGGDLENGGIHSSLSKYDIDSAHKLKNYFIPNERVLVTEKIHGANCRVFFDGENFHVGTRNHWVKEFDKSVHWRAFRSLNSTTLHFLQTHPNYVLYGEATGDVGGFKYGCIGGERKFLSFDIMRPNRTFFNVEQFYEYTNFYSIPTVPTLGIYDYDYERLKKMANGNSLVSNANHIREGVVVRPLIERQTPKFERLIFKIINEEFK